MQSDLYLQKVRKQVSDFLAPIARWYNRTRFDRIAPVDKNIWVNPDDICGWYGGNRYDQLTFQGQIRGGNWSGKIIPAKEIFNRIKKLGSIAMRFEKGVPWSETPLFREIQR